MAALLKKRALAEYSQVIQVWIYEESHVYTVWYLNPTFEMHLCTQTNFEFYIYTWRFRNSRNP